VRVRSEDFFDPREMTALVTIVGPYGALFIDSKIRQRIVTYAKDIVKAIGSVSRELEVFDTSLSRLFTGDVLSEGRKLFDKGLTTLHFAMKEVGKLLALRELMFDRLRVVLEDRQPAIASILEVVHNSYFEAVAKLPKFRVFERVAKVGGRLDTESDAMLLESLSAAVATSANDQRLWQQLSTAFALTIAFRSMDAQYDNATGNFVPGNALCTIKALNMFVEVFAPQPQRVNSHNPSGAIAEHTERLLSCVRTACTVLMAMRESDDKTRQKSWPHIVVFLDKLISGSPSLASVPMDQYLPRTLISSAYRSCAALKRAMKDDVVEELMPRPEEGLSPA